MNMPVYSESELALQALIDMDQWQRLLTELGPDMLREFADEYFAETTESWFDEAVDPFAVDPATFKSLSHRSAGAGGTLGFKKLRYAFLCMEHTEFGDKSREFFNSMKGVFTETRNWVHQQLDV